MEAPFFVLYTFSLNISMRCGEPLLPFTVGFLGRLGVFIRYRLYAFAVYNGLVVETGCPNKRVLIFF